ncbi:MAG: MFS transporter [Acidimicrobiales bacterium]
MKVAFASQMLVNAATFMVLPFVLPHLTGAAGLTMGDAGTVVAVLVLSSRLLAVVSGPVADRMGYRAAMARGLVVAGAGLAVLAGASTYRQSLAAAVVAGFGRSLYEPALAALLARQENGGRLRLFATRTQLLNAGVAIGPAAAAAALTLGAAAPFLVAATILGATGTAISFAPDTPGAPSAAVGRRKRLRSLYAKAVRRRSFVSLWPILVVWWAVFMQLTVSVPLAARELGGEQLVAVVFLLNGMTGIVVLGWVKGWSGGIEPARLLTVGLAITAAGFVMLPLVDSHVWLLSCIVVYTLGESLVLPAIDLLVATSADDETASTFFGLALGAWAVGGAGGVLLGTWLMAGSGPVTPWATYGVLALVGASAVAVYGRSVAGRGVLATTP